MRANAAARAGRLRRLQLLLQCFNSISAWPIYVFKVSAISVGIIHGFFSVRYFHDSVFFTWINVTVTLLAYAYFALVYERTFTIPKKLAGAKKLLTAEAKGLTAAESDIQYLVAFVRSVPQISIRVGVFQNLQRTSTPTFIDFTVRNTARLLLAHR